MLLTRYESKYLEQILALHRSAMDGFVTGINQHDEEADLLSIEQAYINDGGEFLVGLWDERIIAMGGFHRLSDTTAELRRMRIRKDLQGRGYGSQLLLELERKAHDQGFRTLCLETAAARPLTLEFYRKHGYRETGRGSYGEVQTLRFAKALDTKNARPL
jgi:GNAT superfamily N-acetyltransferase